MVGDAPIIVYKRDKDAKKEETMAEKKVKMEKIVADWKAKKAAGKGTKLSDFLGGDAKISKKE